MSTGRRSPSRRRASPPSSAAADDSGRVRRSTGEQVTWAYGVFAGRASDALLARFPRLPDAGAPRAIALGSELFVIAASVPRLPFEAGTLEERLQDVAWVGAYATAHHEVIQRLGNRGTVLPLRLFTVFDSDESAKKTLGRSHRRLAALAKRVGTRSEWVLRVHRPAFTTATATKPGDTEAPAVKRATASGTAFLRGKADARRQNVARARMIDAGVAMLISDLASLADETVERAVEAGTSALAEAAFLIDKGEIADFKRALTKSSADLRREGCRIALTGPWPVYSFVDVAESSRG
jgi:hypothetical protein